MKNFNPDTATNVFAAMRVLFLQEGGDNFTPLDVQEFLQDVMFVKMTTGEISDYMQGFQEGSITVIMAVPSEETTPVVAIDFIPDFEPEKPFGSPSRNWAADQADQDFMQSPDFTPVPLND